MQARIRFRKGRFHEHDSAFGKLNFTDKIQTLKSGMTFLDPVSTHVVEEVIIVFLCYV